MKHRAQVVFQWVVDYSRWPRGHERKISNARLNDLLRIAQSYILKYAYNVRIQILDLTHKYIISVCLQIFSIMHTREDTI